MQYFPPNLVPRAERGQGNIKVQATFAKILLYVSNCTKGFMGRVRKS